MKTPRTIWAAFLVSLAVCITARAGERFYAKGPSSPVKMKPHQQGVVEVHFDLLPTSMRFNAPAYPCMVTENDILKIYTGLASRSLPFGADREPPRVIHEFMEAMVLGKMSGMIDSKEPGKKLVPLAWSWIVPPKVSMQREQPSYKIQYYDPAQKAYVFDWKQGQTELAFELIADPDYYGVASTIVNPAFVVRGWGKAPIQLEIDEERVEPSEKLRIGYEATDSGTNLVLWLTLESAEPVNISLRRASLVPKILSHRRSRNRTRRKA